VGIAGKDELAPAGGEAAPAPALPGLNDDRVALRRARYGKGAARAEMSAVVSEAAHLVGVSKASRPLVDDERVVGPGVPMAMYHLQKLVGAVVACVVLDDLLKAHVPRFDVVHRGDHVPGGTAARHQVGRLEQAGDGAA